MNARSDPPAFDPVDRAIVMATQSGLPLAPRPYHAVGEQIGVSGAEVIARFSRMLETGAVRRMGAVPNHYALGYSANGMSVWDVEDGEVGRIGRTVGALPFVTHCYERVRCPPHWCYNLFAMVHGRARSEVEERVRYIDAIIGDASRSHEILYSTRILKKTGMRLRSR
jgi:DNA-binding Lrp family transcriptional regulator